MRLIFECLSGENGLLYEQEEKKIYFEYIKNKDKREISVDDDIIDCELCNPHYDPDDSSPWTKEQRDLFYMQPMTLLEFMEHEVYHEYEKAKRAIFEKDQTCLAKQEKNNLDGLLNAPFHPVYLSSLMNQTVFRRECMIQKIEKRKLQPGVQEVLLEKEKRSENGKIIEYIKKVLSNIEVQGY